jgi:hypothetical protein
MSGGSASTQFVKGKSGNPKGSRRRAAGAASAFDVVLHRMLEVVQDGKVRALTVEEALQWRTYQAAIAGDRSARRAVLRMIAVREKAITAKQPRQKQPEVVFETADPDNADEALLALGIASLDPRWPGERRLLLEPWAVEAAFARSRELQPEPLILDMIRESTREASAVARLGGK